MRKRMGIVSVRDFKKVAHPHYIINIFLASVFLITRWLKPVCTLLYPSSGCELDYRESEILTFLVVVIMFRTRKHGATSLVPYVSAVCTYTKLANIILFFYHDPRLGILYMVLCLVQLVMLPEPLHQGEDNVIYFSKNDLEEELERDKRIVWLVTFYAPWNPSSVNFAPTFADLSVKYTLENFKFGKIDVGRYPDVAEKFRISMSSFTKQLPTVILFKNGKEVNRRPVFDSYGKPIKFFFNEENILSVFDLNNVYEECKSNPLKKVRKKDLNLKPDHDKAE
ncbi:thioredoxin-related transmembrane protein 2 homolog [Limulus polyphemus]|uniref:Thioredoxin-related transmembrane protein 2 homolog n=1 Tax=Limulus polyphemus TaxID=6850 RepID=A0ABM1B8A1_LIMPO|nr:thioredoxin-related transmembrane protein 2 homolog [Limulus polyphemus]